MASKKASTSAGQKRKKIVLTLNQKVDIIKRLEKGENRKVLMNEYNIGSSTIYDIKAQKDELLSYFDFHSETIKGLEKRHTLHKPKMKQLDKSLYEWFTLKRSEGNPISGPMLIRKAKDIYKQMELTEPCAFSDGWLACFKLRHGIRKLSISGEKQSVDHAAAESYCEFFKKLVSEHELTADQIYNADETGLFWRCLPTSTLTGEGESSASSVKQNKDRLTVLTCANASGNHRIELLVIGKYVRPRALKGVIHLPVEYKAQSNAWMDCVIFSNWFHHTFVPAAKENLRKLNKLENSKVVLLLDNCRAHPSETELVSGNIFTLFLPPNVTSLIQPMIQGVIQNLKFIYKKDFMHQLIHYQGTVKEFQSQYTIKDAVFNIACAWNTVKSQTLRRSWRKLRGPSIADGSFEEEEKFERFDVRRNEVAEIIEMLKQAEPANPLSNLKEVEVEEWINMDNDVEVTYNVNDFEIMDKVVNPEKFLQIQMDSDEEEPEDKTSWAEASSGLSTLIKFVERHSAFSSQEVMQLYTFQKNFMEKRQQACKQTDIRKMLQRASVICAGIAATPSTSTCAYQFDQGNV